MKAANNIIPQVFEAFKKGWSCVRQNSKVIAIIYSINLLVAFIGIGPLKNTFEKNLEQSSLHDGFRNGFDYGLLMDIVNNYGPSIDLSLTNLISMFIPIILWSVFCAGGIINVVRSPNKLGSREFWVGGAKYFFRYLRLGIYVSALIAILIFLISKITGILDLNIFQIKTEKEYQNKVIFTLVLIALVVFFAGIFKELAKVNIALEQSQVITNSNIRSVKQSFTKHATGLGLLHLIAILILTMVYFGLRKLMGQYLIPILIVSQVYLLFRISYRFAKLASYNYLLNQQRQDYA